MGVKEWIEAARKAIGQLKDTVSADLGVVGGAVMTAIRAVDDKIFAAIGTIMPAFIELLPDSVDKVFDHVKDKYKAKSADRGNAVLNMLQSAGFIDEAGRKTLDSIADSFGLGKGLVIIVIAIAIIPQYLAVILSAMHGKISQSYASAFSPNLPDVSSAINLASIAPERYKEAHDILRRNGLDDADIERLFISSYRLYDEGVIRELFLRGEIDGAKARSRLRELRYTDERIDDITKLWSVIPSVSDLISMAVREAFDESSVKALGLDLNFPSAILEWTRKQGLSDDFAKKYWYAHWRLPSLTEGFEMLHRGEITDAELDELLVALDFSPRWHKALKNIAYNLPTRVDLRRIFELGLIDEKKLNDYHLKIGYDPEFAGLLTKWVKTEYSQESKDLTKTEVLRQFVDGFIDEGAAKERLSNLGFTPERAAELMALAEYQKGYAAMTSVVNAVKTLYLRGEISDSEVLSDLGSFRIDTRRIHDLIEQWTFEKRAQVRFPSKTDLDGFFKEGVITEQQYVSELRRLEYPERYVQMYLAHLKKKIASASTEGT